MSDVADNGIKKTVHGAKGIISQMTQIYIDYASMVSPREITLDEISMFYTPLIDGLIELQVAKKKAGKYG
jgi:hypothetical protein